MNRQKFSLLLLLLVFSLPAIVNGQYRLRPAFPNLTAFSNPLEITNADDGTNRMFVVQQRGIIYVFNNSPSVSIKKQFINLSGKVSQSGSETGLLGLAFHPNYENNRYFYVNFTFDSAGTLRSRISRFTASSSNPDTALNNTELILITQTQPFANHNGGKVAFGPDGYLYISFGDGGNGGDPQGNGQNRAVILGKILRINVDSATGGRSYAIPTTNPYFGNVLGYREEIYAYGLRNVWKFSFDFPTNRLWAADVGQGTYEEIDLIERGKNYGWNKMEGFHCYGTCDTTGKGFTRPVFEYNHDTGASVTGGFVYRGSMLPGLYGKYIYADYIVGKIWALNYDGINPTTNQLLQDTNLFLSSFGVDQNNEIYVSNLSLASGTIYKLVNLGAITLNLKLAIEGFYNPASNSLSIEDTVSVYLHQTTNPYNVIDSARTTIDSLSLTGLCFFNNAPTGKYYISIEHRNALETWSRTGGDSLKRGQTNSYDFTTDNSKAYGNNEKLKGSIYCIYSGDVNQNGVIDVIDNSLIDDDAYNFVTGFINTDLNGDGIVDVIDLSIVDTNASNFVTLQRP